MDDLIVKRLRGEATDIEVKQLDHWRAESSENEEAYQAFLGLWNGTGEPMAPHVRSAPAAEEIMREGDARRVRSQARSARRALLRSRWTGVGVAVVATAAVALLVFPRDAERATPTHGLFPLETSSSPEDVTTLALSDGSVLRMMPETRAEFPAGTDRREVVLEGRAFFAVADDSTPFAVVTPVGELIVHGTRFEVSASREELRLVVVEGRVQMASASGSLEVGPGQVARLHTDSPPTVEDHGDIWSVLEWPDGLLIYEATPLRDVASELSRHFGRVVTIADSSLEEIRITAWFEDESLEEVVRAVCMVARLPCEVDDEGIVIGGQRRTDERI